jgi:hypothetical protein
VLDEGLLQLRKLAVLQRQPFNCDDISTFHLAYGYKATIHNLPVDDHGACPTFAFPTALLGAGEVEVLSQYVEQTACTNDIDRNRCPV